MGNGNYGHNETSINQLYCTVISSIVAWAKHGIRVNAVAPGFIVTEQSAKSRTDPAHVAAVNLRTPAGRWGEADDIATPVLFLASEGAEFITGSCIAIDGGYSIA